jgi:hypothetical protein
MFGWDKTGQGLERRVGSLCDRLPRDLRQDVAGEAVPNTPFTMVYELHDECAIELANKTVHDISHLGWVPTGNGDYELRMAALVKPNGLFGRLYMAAIKPFRYLIIYPALTRKWERAWQYRDSPPESSTSTITSPGRSKTPKWSWSRRRSRTANQSREAQSHERREQLTKWAGRLIVFFGTAHTLGALTAEGAARHAGAWFSGELWGNDLASMSPAMSAYWLSVNSFGPSLILIGLTVLWMERRGITPPAFIGWSLGIWTVLDFLVSGPGLGQGLILLVASALLLAGARRATPRDNPALSAHERYPGQDGDSGRDESTRST